MTPKAQQSTSDIRIIQSENVVYDTCKLCGPRQDNPMLDVDLRNTLSSCKMTNKASLLPGSTADLKKYVGNKRERESYLDILYCHSAGIHLDMCSHRTPRYWCSHLPDRHYCPLGIRWYLQASVQVRTKQALQGRYTCYVLSASCVKSVVWGNKCG